MLQITEIWKYLLERKRRKLKSEKNPINALDDTIEMIFTPFKCGAGLTRARTAVTLAGLESQRGKN